MDESSGFVLVTGATGSIGFRLAQRLRELGQPVRALVRDLSRAGSLANLEGVEIVSGDLGQPESLVGCTDGCRAVFHCAAKLLGSDMQAFRAVNVDGTRALLKEAARAGVQRFVHVSTIGVYACSEADDIGEDYPWPHTRNPYFLTKQDAERAAWDAAHHVPLAVARLGDVFGPGQYVWTINLIEKLKRGLLPPPLDAESGIFNPVYIGNAIEALVLVGEHPAALGQALNVVDGTPMRFSDYFRCLARMVHKRTFPLPGFLMKGAAALLMASDLVRGREATTRLGDVDYLLHKATISGAKIRATLGWQPAVGLEDALQRTEQWLQQEGY